MLNNLQEQKYIIFFLILTCGTLMYMYNELFQVYCIKPISMRFNKCSDNKTSHQVALYDKQVSANHEIL